MFGFRKKAAQSKIIQVPDAFMNRIAGAGMRGDTSQTGVFVKSPIAENQSSLETLYVESWAAQKIIDIPVDDQFIYPRTFKDLSDSESDKIVEYQKALRINDRIRQGLKASRLFGTAFIIMVSDDNVMQTPLNMAAKILNLKNLIVADRFHASVVEWDHDIASPNFNNPLIYQFNITGITPLLVHHTRVIRVDEIKKLTSEKWRSGYTGDWGISALTPLYNLITQEEGIATAANYLLNEASIPILKVPELKDALAGHKDADNIDTLVAKQNDIKSIYRTTYLDAEMDLSRLEPSLDHIAELFDKFHLRMAAAADIPETRLLGKCPSGLNSTGESDIQNYAMHVSAMQERILRPIYNKLDKLMLKTLGLDNITLDYEFRKLVDISDDKKADIELKNAQRDIQYLINGILSPEEIRQNLYDTVTYDIEPGLEPIGVDEELRQMIAGNIANTVNTTEAKEAKDAA